MGLFRIDSLGYVLKTQKGKGQHMKVVFDHHFM